MNNPETQAAKKTINLVELVHQANAGDKDSLVVLRIALRSGDAGRLLEIAGNLAEQLEQSTLDAMLGVGQAGTRLLMVKKLNQMRIELGWNNSPKLERVLIERVCQTWLYLHWQELVDVRSTNRPIERAKHEADRIERAERRHLRAVKMLATVRKMALPLKIDVKAELTVKDTQTPAVGSAARFDRLHSMN